MQARTANWTNVVLGIWLFFSPWIFSSSSFTAESSTVWNFWISGALIASIASLALNKLEAWEEWTNLVMGAWVFISPWTLDYSHLAAYSWNAVIVGAIVSVSAMLALGVAELASE